MVIISLIQHWGGVLKCEITLTLYHITNAYYFVFYPQIKTIYYFIVYIVVCQLVIIKLIVNNISLVCGGGGSVPEPMWPCNYPFRSILYTFMLSALINIRWL